MQKQNKLVKMILSALFLALCYVLPFFTGQIPKVGSALLPMHLPVMLCGFVCGGPWGLVVGFVAPLMRSVLTGFPALFPKAVCMAFELAAYGAVAGWTYRWLPRKKISVYVALLTAMVAGRLVWGGAMWVCLGVSGGGFTFAAFWAGAFANALPGILLQLILVPFLVLLFQNNNLFRFKK